MTDLQLTLYLNAMFAVILTVMFISAFVVLIGIGISTFCNWVKKMKGGKE